MFLRSLRLLAQDPEVLLFAGLAALCAVGPVCWALSRLVANPDLMRASAPRWLGGPWGAALTTALLYAPCVAIGSLMNVAVIGCLAKRLEGDEPTLRDGLGAIRDNLASIVEIVLLTFAGLTILAFVANLADNTIKGRGRRIAARALTHAAEEGLSSVSAFVLCVMIIDRVRFVEAFRRALALKQKFPAIVLYGITAGWAVAIPTLLWEVVTVLSIGTPFMDGLSLTAMLLFVMGVPIFLMIASAMVMAVLNLAYICAVYIAATRHQPKAQKAVASFYPELAAVRTSARA